MLSSVSDKIVKKSDSRRNDETLGGGGKKENKKQNVEPFVTKLLQNPTVLLNNEIEDDSRFETYASEFSLVEESDEINELLRDGSEVKTIYSEYVPSKITHKQFWIRYFFLESELRLSRHRVGEIQMREEDLTWGHDADDDVGWDDIDNDSNSDRVKMGDVAQIDKLNSEDKTQNSDLESETKVEELKVEIQRLRMDLENANKVIATLRKENTALKAQKTSSSGSGLDSTIEVVKNEQLEDSGNSENQDEDYGANVPANENENEGKKVEEEVSFPNDLGIRKASGNSSEGNGSWEEDFPEWE